MTTDYWIGPANCLVSNKQDCVPSLYGNSILHYRDRGLDVENTGRMRYTPEEYLRKFCVRKNDKYYWMDEFEKRKYKKEQEEKMQMALDIELERYWKGPFDVLVPNTIKSVIYIDGGNYIYKNGGITEMHVSGEPLSEEEYKERYAIEKNGKWYWKFDLDN